MTDQSRKELIVAALRYCDGCYGTARRRYHSGCPEDCDGYSCREEECGLCEESRPLADAFSEGTLLIVDKADLQSARDAIAPDEHGENDGARNELDRILAGNGTEKETKK